jgi:uncharacterized SAM-binding protein YcdF (DUF218 family)
MIVVLGGGIDRDGNLPIWVHGRLEKTIQLFREKESWILLSGKGKDGYSLTEAEAMANYLIERNIPEDKILLECLSEDTVQNAYFSRTLHIDPMAVNRFTVVTSAFHMERSRHIFEWVFGKGYHIEYAMAPDQEIDDEVLRERKQIETQLLNYHIGFLREVLSGQLQKVHSFIFDNKNPIALRYKQFTKKFTDSRALY